MAPVSVRCSSRPRGAGAPCCWAGPPASGRPAGWPRRSRGNVRGGRSPACHRRRDARRGQRPAALVQHAASTAAWHELQVAGVVGAGTVEAGVPEVGVAVRAHHDHRLGRRAGRWARPACGAPAASPARAAVCEGDTRTMSSGSAAHAVAAHQRPADRQRPQGTHPPRYQRHRAGSARAAEVDGTPKERMSRAARRARRPRRQRARARQAVTHRRQRSDRGSACSAASRLAARAGLGLL